MASDTALQSTLDGYAPIGNLPSGPVRSEIDEHPGGDADERMESNDDDIEKAIVAFVDQCYSDAAAKSLERRQAFDDMFRDAFGDVPGDDDTGLNNYVLPVVGNHARRKAMMLVSRTIPDREQMNFFLCGPAPGAMVDRSAMRDSIVAEMFLRQCLRAGRFDASWDRLTCIEQLTGNCVGGWEWIQEWKCVESGADPLEDMDADEALSGDPGIAFGEPEPELVGVDTIPVAKHEMKLLRQYPIYRIHDLRNVLPCSLNCQEGIPGLDWYCLHETMRWRHLRENRVRKRRSDGQLIGCYANTQAFGPESEHDVCRIKEDVYDYVWYQSDRSIPWKEKGLVVKTWCGRLALEQIGPFNGKRLPEQRAWDSKLRKFGNDPKDCRDVRWFLIQTIDGVLVRMQPHPYYGGEQCPLDHDRYLIEEGCTYGRGMYANGVGVSQNLYNYMNRLVISGSELTIRPPRAIDITGVDPRFIQRRGGAWCVLPPDSLIEINPGAKATDIIQELRPPAESLNQVRLTRDQIRLVAGEYDTMTSTVEGMGPSGSDPTATQSIQDANFSMVPIEFEADRLSRSLSEKLERLGRVIQDYGTQTVGAVIQGYNDVSRLASYDDDTAEQIKKINRLGGQYLQSIGVVYAEMRNDDFFGNMRVQCYGPRMGGGKAARLAATNGFAQLAAQVEKFQPGLTDWRELLMRAANDFGFYAPERLVRDEQGQAMEVARIGELMGMQAMAQGMMGGAMGGDPAMSGKQEGSPPAERGSAMSPELMVG